MSGAVLSSINTTDEIHSKISRAESQTALLTMSIIDQRESISQF